MFIPRSQGLNHSKGSLFDICRQKNISYFMKEVGQNFALTYQRSVSLQEASGLKSYLLEA